MKVILLENLKRIGSIGEVIDVKRGFARNFLIANKKRFMHQRKILKKLKKLKPSYLKKITKRKKKLLKLQSKLMAKIILSKN